MEAAPAIMPLPQSDTVQQQVAVPSQDNIQQIQAPLIPPVQMVDVKNNFFRLFFILLGYQSGTVASVSLEVLGIYTYIEQTKNTKGMINYFIQAVAELGLFKLVVAIASRRSQIKMLQGQNKQQEQQARVSMEERLNEEISSTKLNIALTIIMLVGELLLNNNIVILSKPIYVIWRICLFSFALIGFVKTITSFWNNFKVLLGCLCGIMCVFFYVYGLFFLLNSVTTTRNTCLKTRMNNIACTWISVSVFYISFIALNAFTLVGLFFASCIILKVKISFAIIKQGAMFLLSVAILMVNALLYVLKLVVLDLPMVLINANNNNISVEANIVQKFVRWYNNSVPAVFRMDEGKVTTYLCQITGTAASSLLCVVYLSIMYFCVSLFLENPWDFLFELVHYYTGKQ